MNAFVSRTRATHVRCGIVLAATMASGVFATRSAQANCNLSIVLDLTGSMQTVRTETPNTRCHDAIEFSREMVADFQAGQPFFLNGTRDGVVPDPLASQQRFMGQSFNYADCPSVQQRFVQIVTVSGQVQPGKVRYLAPPGAAPTALPAPGFSSPAGALAQLMALNSANACTGTTPIADAICVAGRGFRPTGGAAIPGANIMKILTDGGENSSAFQSLGGLVQRAVGPGGVFLDCREPGDGDDPTPPFAPNSWQNNTVGYLAGSIGFGVFVNVPMDILHFLNDPLLLQGDTAFFQFLASSFASSGSTYAHVDDGPGNNPHPEINDTPNDATSVPATTPLRMALMAAGLLGLGGILGFRRRSVGR